MVERNDENQTPSSTRHHKGNSMIGSVEIGGVRRRNRQGADPWEWKEEWIIKGLPAGPTACRKLIVYV